MALRRIVSALGLALLVACGDASDDDAALSDAGTSSAQDAAVTNPEDLKPLGASSGATCKSGSMLSYDNFGKAFFSTYCVQCHASTLSGDARHLAPVGHDFDTLAGIRAWRNHIDQYSAAGPQGTNTRMPAIPSAKGTYPSDEERTKLGEWLACGAP